jgi:TM2 domain-containing membrane protein YozV
MALMACGACGRQLSARATTCPQCGAPVKVRSPAPSQPVKYEPVRDRVPKSRSVAIALAVLFGGIGLHKFYLNRPGLGVLYVLFCWTLIPAVLGLLEGLVYLILSDADFHRLYFKSRRATPGQVDTITSDTGGSYGRQTPLNS